VSRGEVESSADFADYAEQEKQPRKGTKSTKPNYPLVGNFGFIFEPFALSCGYSFSA
jgi:hypothetical protein